MEDFEYIKRFSKITITKACKKLKINRGNLLNGRTTSDNIKKVREELESEVGKLYVKEEELKNEDNRNNSCNDNNSNINSI